jgi:hypothetical protein
VIPCTTSALVIRVPAWAAGRLRRIAAQRNLAIGVVIEQGLALIDKLQLEYQMIPQVMVPPKRNQSTVLLKAYLGTTTDTLLRHHANRWGISLGSAVVSALQVVVSASTAPAPQRGRARATHPTREGEDEFFVVLDDEAA